MKFILGKKQHMMQCFQDDGKVVPTTVISAGPLIVTQIKSPDKDGYTAVQVAFEEQKESRANKAHLGHILSSQNEEKKEGGAFKHLREFRDIEEMATGDRITVSAFQKGDIITVTGISKGKGFQGGVKRYGFKGGPRSHGQKHSEREPGSLGGGGRDGGRVAKGKRMAGRMGGDRITTKGLTVVSVKPETGEIFVRGSVPGRRGTLVEVNG